MSSDRRILLLGMGPTTASALEGLRERFDVCCVVRPGNDSVSRSVKDAGIPVVDAVGPAEVARLVDDLRPDAVVVSSYDRILPADTVARCPFVNVHYAPLPRYRGRATVNWAIINGETETAMTVHCLEPELDAGGILVQAFVPIGPRTTVSELYDHLNELQREALPDAVERRLRGDRGVPQDETRATYCCTRVPSDGEIDWAASATEIDRLVRALGGPYPPAFTYVGTTQVAVLRARPVASAPRFEGAVPGRVIRVDRASGEIEVLTGDGVLRVERASRRQGGEVPPAALVRSVRETLGLRLPDLLARLEVLDGQRMISLEGAR